ncbi:SocA family protein [Priestia megaterium]|uniref:Panacea domain-containing protein n=1 Tax=Priestia megaterium TaxID=1404 RepID=UPI002378D730|nr:type II toxin-antitoxin system antitoxin SocA domain-containing protein [Priestia megaterium]WDM33686.1 SocA family protein [Priestia megaterium]
MMEVRQVALYFRNKSLPGGKFSITHLKLQKLVYYAQAWSLAIEGEPIINSDLEAWLHGPVSRELYGEYRNYGSQEIPPVEDHELKFRIDDTDKKILDGVWELYGEFDGKYLETLTHKESPWINAWDRGMNEIIELDDMEQYYSGLLQGAN